MQHIRLLLFFSFLFLSVQTVQAQVDADFTYSATTGCGSLQVSFCDFSQSATSQIVSWDWDLGGAPSNLECPGRVFGIPGSYTICLTVTDADGNSDTECKTDLITVYNLPDPDFIADKTQDCAPGTFAFTDMSNSIDGNINEWTWGLGGSCGTIVTTAPNTPAAICTYGIPDDYSISLTVKDDNGCVNTITKDDYLTVSEVPAVSIAASSNFGCEAPFTVSFLNTSTQASVMDFEWNFGNGQEFSGDTPPPVTYSSNGTYSITVIGTNTNTGCSDTLILEDYITIGYPIDFDYTPSEGCVGMSVDFTDLSPNVASEVTWDFGDGNTSNDPSPTHTFNTPGCYFVKLTRTVSGCETEQYAQQCILVNAPSNVTVSNDNNIGCSLPHVVNFTGISSDVTSWLWDFGDGTSQSTLQNPTHVYNSYGTFEVNLITTNVAGCTDTMFVNSIDVREVVAQLVDDDISGCAPLEITLCEDSESVTSITNWSWQVSTTSNTFISFSECPTFTISDTGKFDVILTVTNTLGCSNTVTFDDVINIGDNPTLSFDATPTESCVETPIDFTDMSEETVDYWYWDFGDGNDAEEQNPTHFYLDTGYYDVNLIGSHNGCVSSITYQNYIHITAPVAKYDIIEFCDNNFQRKFKDNSVGADSILWDFGVTGITTDTSTAQNPDFIYPDTGYYDVSMTVFNATTGCQHTRMETIHVTNPKALFTPSVVNGCAPLTVTLQDQSEFAENYTWSTPSGVLSDPNVAEPTLYLEDPGAYTGVQLIIQDENNCRDTMVLSDMIYANTIEMDLGVDISGGCVPLTTTFTDLSNNLYTNNTSWEWTFGENLGTSNAQSPSFTFDETGEFAVELTVTDDWGCSATQVFDNAVSASQPIAFFETEDFGCTGNSISFINISDGEDLSFLWDFGDGTSTEEAPEHSFSAEGVYTVCLTITDVNNCSDTYCLDDYITINDPEADFTVDNNFASCPPMTVNFTNMSTDAVEYKWDFGDGTTSTQEEPTHVYTIPGTYEVMLIASSTPFCHDTIKFDDFIVLDGPVGEYVFDVDSTCAPATITFIGNSVADYEYTWDMGDGQLFSSNAFIDADTIVYTYALPGNYTPTLSLENQTGCFRTLPNHGPIRVSALTADFTASDTLLCDDNVPITFFNLSSTNHPLTKVDWSFEDGNPLTSEAVEEIVTFDNVGTFDVTMIVSNGFCSDTLTKNDFISIGPKPTADYVMDTNEGCEPLSVSFTDQSGIAGGSITDWEWEFGDGFGANGPNTNHDFAAGEDIPVSLIVTSAEGCRDTMTQTVTSFAATAVDLGDDLEICIGETVPLIATVDNNLAGATYGWAPATGLSCTNCLDPLADPVTTTTYTFTFVNADGCETIETVTVQVLPYSVPTVTTSPDLTICANTSTTLSADAGAGNYTYEWDASRPGLDCYLNCANPVATPTQLTTYVVTVTSEFGCSTVDSITVDVLDESQSFAGDDRIICEGGSAQLNLSMGNNPVWLVTDGLSCTNCASPIASPGQPTTYVVQVTTNFGCTIFDTLSIDIMYPEDINAGFDQSICLGEEVSLFGIGDGTVSWSPAEDFADPGVWNPVITPTETTTYFMTVTNGDCSLTDAITVEVTEYTDIELEDMTICEGEMVALEVDGQADIFEWLPGPGLTNLTSPSPMVNPADTTTYTVIATLASCQPDTATITVNVIPAPETELASYQDVFPGSSIQLDLEADDPFYAHVWSPDIGLSCITCEDPVATPDTVSMYYVTTTDFNTGCSAVDSIRMNLLNTCPSDLISLPNIFTPNFDGQNDILDIYISETLLNYGSGTFRIYDRWGALMYETDDLTQGWDGTYRGKAMPDGVYLYYIEAPCPITGGTFIVQGDVTLLR